MTFNLEPVKRDKAGKRITSYEVRDFYEKIGEELLEAHTQAIFLDWAKGSDAFDEHETACQAGQEILELFDLMTAVATRINALADEHGFSDERLAEMQGYIVEHNRKRGYFD